MKKIINICLIFAVTFSSCYDETAFTEYIPKIQKFTYNGHEYLKWWSQLKNARVYEFTHSGECNNPIHFGISANYEYIIDLPEEYMLISRNDKLPDTLIGNIRNDTLFIQFLKHYNEK